MHVSHCDGLWESRLCGRSMREWSTENWAPHLQDWGRGVLAGFYPYIRHRASPNSLSCRSLKPCSFRGRTESHKEEPISLTRSALRFCSGVRWPLMIWAFLSCLSLLAFDPDVILNGLGGIRIFCLASCVVTPYT